MADDGSGADGYDLLQTQEKKKTVNQKKTDPYYFTMIPEQELEEREDESIYEVVEKKKQAVTEPHYFSLCSEVDDHSTDKEVVGRLSRDQSRLAAIVSSAKAPEDFSWIENVNYEGFQSSEDVKLFSMAGSDSPGDAALLYEELAPDLVAEQGFFIDDELLYDDIPAYDHGFAGETDSLSSWGSDEWDKSDEDESGADSDVNSYYEDTPQTQGINRQGSVRTPGRSRKFESTELRDEDGVLRLLDFRKAPNEKQEDEKEEESPYIDVNICDSRHPPPELPPEPEGLSKEDTIRRHIVQSIIDSENSYVKTLKRVIQDYQVPLENSPQILEREKVDVIFKQIRAIHQCHSIFQIALAARVKEWDTVQCLGDVFVASIENAALRFSDAEQYCLKNMRIYNH